MRLHVTNNTISQTHAGRTATKAVRTNQLYL